MFMLNNSLSCRNEDKELKTLKGLSCTLLKVLATMIRAQIKFVPGAQLKHSDLTVQ